MEVLRGFKQYFNCGNVNAKDSKKAAFYYVCGSLKDNLGIIIPFSLSILFMVQRLYILGIDVKYSSSGTQN